MTFGREVDDIRRNACVEGVFKWRLTFMGHCIGVLIHSLTLSIHGLGFIIEIRANEGTRLRTESRMAENVH